MAAAFFAGGFVISAGILAWQVFQWLHFGVWPEIPVSYAFDYFQIRYPVVAWVGVQQIFNAVLQWPLSLTIFGASALMGWLVDLAEVRERRDQETRRRNEAWDRKNKRGLRD